MAPLVAVVDGSQQLVGTVTLVENAGKTMGVTSAELLRPHATAKLRVLTELDGSKYVDVMGIGMGRYTGLGLVELAKSIPDGGSVKPLTLDHVCATNDTRGAPAGIVAVVAAGDGALRRVLVSVAVETDDGGGMSDRITRLAVPLDDAYAGLAVEGCPVFAWFPPNPALGLAEEVRVVAVAYPPRVVALRPALAELVPLDDLGRALISKDEHDTREELPQVAGEIVETAAPDPLAGLDE